MPRVARQDGRILGEGAGCIGQKKSEIAVRARILTITGRKSDASISFVRTFETCEHADVPLTQRQRFVSARSTNSSPCPLRTAFSANNPKPFTCSRVIVGGIESS